MRSYSELQKNRRRRKGKERVCEWLRFIVSGCPGVVRRQRRPTSEAQASWLVLLHYLGGLQ